MKLKGWDVMPYLNKTLFIIKLDPTDFNLANNRIKNELPKLIEEKHASRVVIDPISLFEDLFNSDSERRREMYRFIEGLRDRNCTIMMTSETDRDNVFSSRHGLIEYLSDTVILLRYVRPTEISVDVTPCPRGSQDEDVGPFPGDQTLRSEAGPDRGLLGSECVLRVCPGFTLFFGRNSLVRPLSPHTANNSP